MDDTPKPGLPYPKLRNLAYTLLPEPTLRYPSPCIICGQYNMSNLPWISLPCGHGGHGGSCISNLSNLKCTVCNAIGSVSQ